jgi:AcrR family transcriptional regulator
MSPQPQTADTSTLDIQAPVEPPKGLGPGPSPRQRLLDGLAQAIREKGLQLTKISDIVRNARTSKRTFYECFDAKEACLAALAEEWAATLRDAVDTGVDRKAAWDAQIDAAVDAFIAAVAQDPVLAVAISRELPMFGRLQSALWEKDIDLYAAFYMKLSRGRRMRDAGVRPLSSEKAIILVGGLSELIDRCLRTGGSLEAAGDEMKETMKLIIGPR